MPIIIITIILALLTLFCFRTCGLDENAHYRVTYGSWLDYVEVKNVHKYTKESNCITYTYGSDQITDTYCGDDISIFPQ